MKVNISLIVVLLIMATQGCKRPERNPSVEYDPKQDAVLIPFTNPTCTVPTTYYVYMKMGTATGTYYIQSIDETDFNKNGYRNIKVNFGSNTFLEFRFRYMRPELSANYLFKTSELSVDKLGFNDVAAYGHNIFGGTGPGSLNSNQGGLLHVEYIPGAQQYCISACDVPFTYKLNTSGATQTMTLSFKIYSY